MIPAPGTIKYTLYPLIHWYKRIVWVELLSQSLLHYGVTGV